METRKDTRATPQRPWTLGERLRRAPLHDFPVRDEILRAYLSLDCSADVLEIGPGSGYTAFWLSRLVRHLTIADAAEHTVSDLREKLGSLSNVDCLRVDVAEAGMAERLDRRFDFVFGLDVFEYVPDPAMALWNFAQCLCPGGKLLLTFPNELPPKGDGVTRFAQRTALETLLLRAGFRGWEIFAVRLNRYANAVYGGLHETPLRLYRKLRKGNPNGLPQVYEATWAFQNRGRLERIKPFLHLYWEALEKLMRAGGDLFAAEPVEAEALGRQLVVRAWK